MTLEYFFFHYILFINQYFYNLEHVGHEDCLEEVKEISCINESFGDNETIVLNLLLDSNLNFEDTDDLRLKDPVQITTELVNNYSEFSNQPSVPNVLIVSTESMFDGKFNFLS